MQGLKYLFTALPLLAAGLLVACSDGSLEGEGAETAPLHPLDAFSDELGVTALYANPSEDRKVLAGRGEAIAQRSDTCVSCHEPIGSAATGPSLAGVSDRYVRRFSGDVTRAKVWLHHKVLNSKKYAGMKTPFYSSALMPDFTTRFSPQETQAIVEYLFTLKAAK